MQCVHFNLSFSIFSFCIFSNATNTWHMRQSRYCQFELTACAHFFLKGSPPNLFFLLKASPSQSVFFYWKGIPPDFLVCFSILSLFQTQLERGTCFKVVTASSRWLRARIFQACVWIPVLIKQNMSGNMTTQVFQVVHFIPYNSEQSMIQR